MNPSRKKLIACLDESVFDPRSPGPLTVIVTDSSAPYLVQRAIEVLKMTDLNGDHATNDARIRDAISILACARLRAQEVHKRNEERKAELARVDVPQGPGLLKPAVTVVVDPNKPTPNQGPPSFA